MHNSNFDAFFALHDMVAHRPLAPRAALLDALPNATALPSIISAR
jgi:hypothetical protein